MSVCLFPGLLLVVVKLFSYSLYILYIFLYCCCYNLLFSAVFFFVHFNCCCYISPLQEISLKHQHRHHQTKYKNNIAFCCFRFCCWWWNLSSLLLYFLISVSYLFLMTSTSTNEDDMLLLSNQPNWNHHPLAVII